MSAEELFDLGYSAFWSGNMSAALEHLTAATRIKDDLHAWSYLALAHAILGHSEQARDAARMAAALEFLHPGLSGEALERLPVQWRAVLAQGRRDVPTLSAAKAVTDARTRQEHPDRLKNLRTDRR
jgi:hypothetical protein